MIHGDLPLLSNGIRGQYTSWTQNSLFSSIIFVERVQTCLARVVRQPASCSPNVAENSTARLETKMMVPLMFAKNISIWTRDDYGHLILSQVVCYCDLYVLSFPEMMGISQMFY